MTKKQKTIDKLCREAGYPNILLTYQQYCDILVLVSKIN